MIIKLSLNKLPPLGSALVASQMNTKTNHPKNANENKLFNVPVPKIRINGSRKQLTRQLILQE